MKPEGNEKTRRDVRVPVKLGVVVNVEDRKVQAHSLDISAGGMSLKVEEEPSAAPMVLSFHLPQQEKLTVTAAPCWTRPEDRTLGVRFGPLDERRLEVRDWIEHYLGKAPR
jgi:c-di-GMP-binding flagellar brake protein YcgR